MTGNYLRLYLKIVLSLLMLCSGGSALLAQPDSIIVNSYARVQSRTANQVVVNDASFFTTGDTVLIIQMQGVAINTSDALGYGTTVEQRVGIPGRYEFLIIQNKAGNTLTFGTNINKYDPLGNVQILKVPSYNTLNQSKVITCKKWDRNSKTGGVVAIIVGKTLTLSQNIDVSGKGFTGGKDTIGLGNCSDASGILDKYSFPRSFQNAGYKGEGLASNLSPCPTCLPQVLPDYLKGQGALFTGGGGGNGKFSGGGGGSNRGFGGQGGLEYYLCSGQINRGGFNGVSVTDTKIDTITGGIFMGGGGGASTRWAGSISTAGGNGGGIIIIVTDELIGNGHKIIADGKDVSTAKQNAGAGGGGGGGSVIISSNSLLNVELSVKGGKGGNHLEGFGEGGGGGGGLLWISQNSKPPSITNTFNGGLAGLDTIQSTSTASPGFPGEDKYNFRAQLNGFLFNSIRSSVTGNQTDSVCSNVVPPKIVGTTPVGGTPGTGYLYTWEKSYDQSTWINLVNNSTDQAYINYTPAGPPETTTVYYRRTVTDHSTPSPIIDYGNTVKIIVQPAIQNNNIIASPDTICMNGDPQILKQTLPDLIVPSTSFLKYIWQDSTDGISWGSPLAPETVKEFDPNPTGGLTKTTWYRRTVVSGSCVDKGFNSIVRISVLNKISNNGFSQLYDTICFGGNTNLNTIPGLTGGVIGKYTYLWESNATGPTGPWTPVVPSQTGSSFDPDASSSLPVGDHYYRRTVFSGEQNACKDSGAVAARKVLPVIGNNLIQSTQIICSGDVPQQLTGVTASPSGGTGAYSYLWEQSTDGAASWGNAENANNAINYSPHSLTAAASYRRTVYSGLYKSAPVCTNTSPFVSISVQPSISNNTISILGSGPDTTICNGQRPNQLIKTGPLITGGDGNISAQWIASSSATGTYTNITGATGLTFSEASLSSSRFYKLKVSSGKCLSESNIASVNVLPNITGFNIESDQSVCKNLPLPAISSISPGPSGGDGNYRYKWLQNISNTGWTNILSNSTSASYSKSSISDPTQFKRYIYSGPGDCCQDTSNIVSISILPLPALPNPGPDTTIYSLGKVYQMKATPLPAGETGAWTIVSGDGKTDDNSYNTFARELNGSTTFLWTVTKGTCTLDSAVVITLNSDDKAIPQGFSPNYDSKNDVFKIEGLYKKDETVQLSIVNGAGTEVFSTYVRDGDTSTWKDWDGRNSAGIDLPEGTYYYILKVTTSKGYVSRKSGFIILKRY
jgi:gliding motility-associated-like protein